MIIPEGTGSINPHHGSTWATLALRTQQMSQMSHRGGLRGCPPRRPPEPNRASCSHVTPGGPAPLAAPPAATSVQPSRKAHGICYLSLRWGGDRPEPLYRHGWGVLQPHLQDRERTGLAASGAENGHLSHDSELMTFDICISRPQGPVQSSVVPNVKLLFMSAEIN